MIALLLTTFILLNFTCSASTSGSKNYVLNKITCSDGSKSSILFTGLPDPMSLKGIEMTLNFDSKKIITTYIADDACAFVVPATFTMIQKI